MALRLSILFLLAALTVSAAACGGGSRVADPRDALLLAESAPRVTLAEAGSAELFLDRAERWLDDVQKDVPGVLRAKAERPSPDTLSVRIDLKKALLASAAPGDMILGYAVLPQLPVRLDIHADPADADLILHSRLFDERTDRSMPFPFLPTTFVEERHDLVGPLVTATAHHILNHSASRPPAEAKP